MRRLRREAPPGEKWVYKTGETNLLGVLVTEATDEPLATHLSERIWAAYGMERDAQWQLDATDHEQGGCCLMAALRDHARFGQFILDGAEADGRSVVAGGWLVAATHKQAETGRPGIGYGYQRWVRDNGVFDAAGIHGQMTHLDPARRLVIAINSVWPVAIGQVEGAARLQLLRTITDAIDAQAH
jgi:CubicO group peptidase (beta-lactamase class C family)